MVSMFSHRISSMPKSPRRIEPCSKYLFRTTTWLLFIHRFFHPIFVHGDHNARTGFVFMRKEQISWRTLQPKHHPDFDFLFGNQGPRHYPLNLHLSKWFPTPNSKHQECINRFRLRQAWTQNTPNGPISWLRHVRSSQYKDLRCHRLIVIWPWKEILFRYVRIVFRRSDGRRRWILLFDLSLLCIAWL